jgi:hypothetical protein
MSVHPAIRGVWSFVFSILLLGSLSVSQAQEELPPEIDSDGVQTLTRGPVHEAFASPTVADPKPGLVVPKPPPADIREQPPEYQPDGQNVQWFPGYWAWDEDRDDYIWISGAWRDPPPGKRWVPGYWAELNGGFQWVSGFWIDDQVEEMEYLKAPPASLEQGPTMASPGDDYFYIPGTWTYVNNDYQWSAGYYAPYREDWIYVQPHWVWTPRGYIFINGYWDWRVPRRGQIFAPIYVTSVVYQRPNYYYTPRCTINTSNLFVHLWVRDSYCHYYFGNYYGPTYAHRHFTPWCNYNSRPHCHDPLFTYCNVHYHRQGINYSQRMQGWHKHYDHHEHERPAKTWREQVAHHSHQTELRGGNKQSRPAFMGEDLKDIVRKPDQHWKKQDIATRDHNKTSIEQVKQLHNLRLNQEKVSLVSNNGPGRDGPGRDLPGRDLPGRDNDRNDNGRSPSKRDSVPGRGPDLKLPGSKPDGDNPGDKIVATQQALTGKIKLPKSTTTTNLSPNKPRITVPEKPEKTVVSRPIDRNPLDRNPGDFNPSKLPKVVDKTPDDNSKRNPLDNPGRLPGSRNPTTNLGPQLGGPTNTNVETPKVNPLDKKPLDIKPRDTNPLTNREPKKPDLGGNASSTSALQQKIDAMRQQQQDAINAARNRKPEVTTPKVPNLGSNNANGGNTTRTIEAPKVDLTPKVERTPKVELPKREVTRPPLSSGGTTQPRNFGGNSGNAGGNPGGINLGGSKEPRSAPRSFTPPSVEPRTVKPNIQPTQPSRSSTIQGLQPRNSAVPRVNPGNSNPGNSGGNNDKEKKRGR